MPLSGLELELTAPVIDLGLHVVEAMCPQCGSTEEIPLELSAQLRINQGESKLALRSKASVVPHSCKNGSTSSGSES